MGGNTHMKMAKFQLALFYAHLVIWYNYMRQARQTGGNPVQFGWFRPPFGFFCKVLFKAAITRYISKCFC